MEKRGLTDEEVELEIARLTCNPDVQLARAEQRLRYRRRQYLYQLRNFQKHGMELRAAGITEDVLRKMAEDTDDD